MKSQNRVYLLIFLLICSEFAALKKHSFTKKNSLRHRLKLRSRCTPSGSSCKSSPNCCAGSACNNYKATANGLCEECIAAKDCTKGTDPCCGDELCLPCPKVPGKHRCQKCLKTGENCDPSDQYQQCCFKCDYNKRVCVGGGGGNTPVNECVQYGGSCNSKNECCPNLKCESGECVVPSKCGKDGVYCEKNRECCQGYECVDNECKIIDRSCKHEGQTCTGGECCKNLFCDSKNYCSSCVAYNERCGSTEECCSPHKCESDSYGTLRCLTGPSSCLKVSAVCNPKGVPCCINDKLSCIDGQCKKCKETGGTCNNDLDCCSGFICYDDNGFKYCDHGSRCKDKGEDCEYPGDCCEGYKCLTNGKCDDCVEFEGKSCEDNACCEGMVCTRNSIGKGKYCYKTPPCIEDHGKCLKPEDCCTKGAKCKDSKCTVCNDQSQDCISDSDCCGSLKCVFDSLGEKKICESEQGCIKLDGSCQVGVKECCENENLFCNKGKCAKCVLKGEKCTPKDKCCNSLFCLWEPTGEFKSCKEYTHDCINPDGKCGQEGQTCCVGFCNEEGLCKDCLKESDDCMEGGKECCGDFGCFEDMKLRKKVCRKGPDCSQQGGLCTDVSNCCDKTLLCRKGKCLPCMANEEYCQNNEDCCSKICYFNTQGKKACVASKDCMKAEGDVCHVNGDEPDCCTGMRCLANKCHKCSVDEGTCKTSNDCCTVGLPCYWNPEGTTTVCTTNNCVRLGGDCRKTDIALPKKCCQGDCYDGMTCSICKAFNDLCIGEGQGSCCPGLKCFFSSKGDKRCLSEEKCVSEEPFKCGFEGGERPYCCKGYRCVAHRCQQCKANDEECDDSKKCCSGYCGNHPLGHGKICKDFDPDDCIRSGGICDLKIHLKCCEGEKLTCYNGKCIEFCKLDGDPCRKKHECCSKNCVFNKQGVQKCGQKNECVENVGGRCDIHNGQPECCQSSELKCINQTCRLCQRENDACEVSTDCCEDGCYWNTAGNRKECNSRTCMNINEPCEKFPVANPPKTCCQGICYSGTCQECIDDNNPCVPNQSKCCSGHCGYNTNGERVCLKESVPCTNQLKGKCEIDGENPKCCEDQGLHCFNGYCESCMPDDHHCESIEECCNRNCYWDSDGQKKKCRAGEKCISINGDCSKDFPEKICCKDLQCYKSKCVNKCVDDNKPCNLEVPCCSGQCVVNPYGDEICGYQSDCVGERFPCDEFDPGNGFPKRECCSQYHCKDQICQVCKENSIKCERNEDCCSNNCDWDEYGLRMKCYPKDFSPCIKIDENCLDDPRLKKKSCCNEGVCYEGKCVLACKNDNEECSQDSDCCSEVCAFKPTTKKKFCTKNRQCVSEGPCELENGEPKCCTGLTCHNKNCSECLPHKRKCTKDEECCDGNCYWDDNGQYTECRNDSNKCIAEEGFCGKSREDITSIPKSCCEGTKCFNSKCKKCDLDDGEECTSDESCCSGKCVINSHGKSICGEINNCIEQEGSECNPKGSGPKECCENKNIFCIEGFCKFCKPKKATCSFNHDCCSGICGWDEYGKENICQEKDFCINLSGICDLSASPNSKVSPRNCCQGSCYRGKCANCLGDNQICKSNNDCCSQICTVTGDGEKKCKETKNCALQNQKCHLIGEEPSCCIGLSCNGGVCTSCKSEGEACNNHLECCNLHCHFDIKFNIHKCKKMTGTSLTQKCSREGRKCISHENCCENLICINKKCTGNCSRKDQACDSLQCCVGLDCVDNKCMEVCSKANEKCDEENPCCYGLICSPDSTCYDPYACSDKDMPCTKDYDCCSGVCNAEKCENENPDCKDEGIGCVIHTECCEGYCYHGECQKVPMPSCSHYREICRNSKDCCFGLICENGVCNLEEDKTRKCLKLGMTCDFDNTCCKGLDCIKAKCTKLPPCKKENEICNVGECCGFLGCYYDEVGVDLKCFKSKHCITGSGFCDRKERLCCKGFCHKENCRTECLPEHEECCEDSECCTKFCFNGKCKKRPCYTLDQPCDPEIDNCCQPQYTCNKEKKVCEKSTCLIKKREVKDLISESITDRVKRILGDKYVVRRDKLSKKFDQDLTETALEKDAPSNSNSLPKRKSRRVKTTVDLPSLKLPSLLEKFRLKQKDSKYIRRFHNILKKRRAHK